MAAAKARSQADWLIGLNATRCATLAARGADPNARIPLISIGRVQAPTLGLLVQRTKERSGFSSRTFHTLTTTFLTPDGESYDGVLVEDESARLSAGHAFGAGGESTATSSRPGETCSVFFSDGAGTGWRERTPWRSVAEAGLESHAI